MSADAGVVDGRGLESMEQGYYRMPKRDLIVGLQVLVQRRELQVSKHLAESAALAKEMADMRVKVALAGNEQFGA